MAALLSTTLYKVRAVRTANKQSDISYVNLVSLASALAESSLINSLSVGGATGPSTLWVMVVESE